MVSSIHLMFGLSVIALPRARTFCRRQTTGSSRCACSRRCRFQRAVQFFPCWVRMHPLTFSAVAFMMRNGRSGENSTQRTQSRSVAPVEDVEEEKEDVESIKEDRGGHHGCGSGSPSSAKPLEIDHR